MTMEEKKGLQYGKTYRVGNYRVLKINRVLRKSDVAELRNQMGIPAEDRKLLKRAQLPYIKVEAISGIWSIEFCCNTNVFRMIDTMLNEDDSKSVTMFAHLFNMWYMDTAVIGDEEYQDAKAVALKSFMERQKAKSVTEEEDAKTLEELKSDEEAKATIVEMGNELRKEDSHEG